MHGGLKFGPGDTNVMYRSRLNSRRREFQNVRSELDRDVFYHSLGSVAGSRLGLRQAKLVHCGCHLWHVIVVVAI